MCSTFNFEYFLSCFFFLFSLIGMGTSTASINFSNSSAHYFKYNPDSNSNGIK